MDNESPYDPEELAHRLYTEIGATGHGELVGREIQGFSWLR